MKHQCIQSMKHPKNIKDIQNQRNTLTKIAELHCIQNSLLGTEQKCKTSKVDEVDELELGQQFSRARSQALGYYVDFAQRLAYFGYERVHSHDQSIIPFELLFERNLEQTSSRPKSTSSSIRKLCACKI